MFLFFIKFKFLWKNDVSEKIKARLRQDLQHYNNFSVPIFLISFKKIVNPTLIWKRGQKLCILYESLQRREKSCYNSIWQISYLQNWKVITLEEKFKNRMKNAIPNIPNYLHISDPNLQWYEFRHIVINFIPIFPWHSEINICGLLLEDFFVAHKKFHVSECVCKICHKELGILLKCRKIFEKFLAACRSCKNTGLPQFFFTGLWQLDFKNTNVLTKSKRCLLC